MERFAVILLDTAPLISLNGAFADYFELPGSLIGR